MAGSGGPIGANRPQILNIVLIQMATFGMGTFGPVRAIRGWLEIMYLKTGVWMFFGGLAQSLLFKIDDLEGGRTKRGRMVLSPVRLTLFARRLHRYHGTPWEAVSLGKPSPKEDVPGKALSPGKADDPPWVSRREGPRGRGGRDLWRDTALPPADGAERAGGAPGRGPERC